MTHLRDILTKNIGPLGKGAIAALIINSAAVVINFALQLILTRSMSPSSFGAYAYVMSWLSVLLLVGTGGVDSVFLRFVPQYDSQQAHGTIRNLLKWGYNRAIGATVFVIFFLTAGVTIFKDNISSEVVSTFYTGSVFLFVWTLVLLRQSYFRGLNRIVAARIPDVILRPALLCVGILVASSFGFDITAPRGMGIHLLVAILTLAVGWLIFRGSPLKGEGSIDKSAWSAAAQALLGVAILSALVGEIDKIILGFSHTLDEVARYSVASRVSAFAAFAPDALMMIAVPLLSRYSTEKSPDELQKFVRKVSLGAVAVSIPCALILIIGGPGILSLFGDTYREAYLVLVILTCGHCLTLMNGSGGYLLVVSGKHRELLFTMGIVSAISIFFTTIASLKFGLEGVAIVTVLVNFLRTHLYARATKRLLGIDSFVTRFKLT